MRCSALIFIIIILGQKLSAQIPISHINNALRSGDVLCKIKVNFVDAGDSGENRIWTLGDIKKTNYDFFQGIVSNGDTIAVLDKERIMHYLMYGDTLFHKGEQQKRSYRLYEKMRPVICYPFQYGDSISGDYSGKGREENFNISAKGWGYTTADGTGIITDGIDSLHNITRLHLFDEYTENYGERMEVNIQRNCYVWYSAGYRYPVMESIMWKYINKDMTESPMDSVTYLFFPVQQKLLNKDAANDSVLSRLSITADTLSVPYKSITDIKAHLSSDGMRVQLNYSLSDISDITFYICDIIGNKLGMSKYKNKGAGKYTEYITLQRKPAGNILILQIQCGNDVILQKINHRENEHY